MNTLPKKHTTMKSIHPATKMGHVSLSVNSLENQIAFYQKALGLQLHRRDNTSASLGAGGDDLLHLLEQPNVRRYQRVTGLYHFAVLYSDRRELARAIARLFAQQIPNYPTDHIMTKSTYFNDPEGNGIELYTESPEDGEWFVQDGNFFARRSDGSLSNGRESLDMDGLLNYLKEDDRFDNPAPEDTRIGHVHLHIRDLDEAVDFYHGLIGFDVMGFARTMRAAFVSAGGYHHHLGLNTWQGEGAPPPPSDALGLRYFSIVLPNQSELETVLIRLDHASIPFEPKDEGTLVYDPSENGLLLKA
jgi:catechol 2,3-dioxygenase